MAAERRSPPSPSSSNWSNWTCLHRDVMDSILDRLVLVSDLIRVRAVCKSWNYLCLNYYKEKRILAINHHLPWLVVEPSEKDPKIHNLYDLTSSNISNCQFDIPFRVGGLAKSFYYGSSHGWLFVVHDSLTMFNPISGTFIPLPPLIDGICTSGRTARITLSTDPSTSLTSPFEILLTPAWKVDIVAHWKSGDKFWTYSEYNSFTKEGDYRRRFHDIIFYKHRMLGIASVRSTSTDILGYAVYVITININNSQACGGGDSGSINIKKIASTPRLEGLGSEGHLVETTKGELLMVYKYTNKFRVYKLLICSDDSAKIIPIKSLDGDSLFLAAFSHSVSILASNYPACMSNSIYYASISHPNKAFEVFNMEDESVSHFLLPKAYNKVFFVHWIVPSMKL